MTVQQTRQLGIEFERRLHEIYPNFASTEKLDSDTIYSFLSEYQSKYVKDLYLIEDQTQRGTRASRRVNDATKPLIRHRSLVPDKHNQDSDVNSVIFRLPEDYFLYIRSNSAIDKNYKSPNKLKTTVYVPNHSIKHDDISSVTDVYYDQKAIMRHPAVIVEGTEGGEPYIKVIHDGYTHVVGLDLVYYCQPYAFNVMKYNDDDMSKGAVHSYCELPFSCFDDLLQGAIDLYIQNYKFKLAGNNSRQRQPKQQEAEQ